MEVNSKTKDLEVIKSTENSWDGNKAASFQGQFLFFYCVWLQIKVNKINPRHKRIFSPYLPGFQNKNP